jgi:ATP-dependent DNA ligase
MGRDTIPLQITTRFRKLGGSTKGKKEKKNVLIDLELVNLKSVYLLNFEELRRRATEAKKKKLVEANEY